MFGLIGKNLLNKIELEVIIEKISTNPRKIILNEENKIEEILQEFKAINKKR